MNSINPQIWAPEGGSVTQTALNQLPQDIRQNLVNPNAGPLTQEQVTRLWPILREMTLDQKNLLWSRYSRFLSIWDRCFPDGTLPTQPQNNELEQRLIANRIRFEANRARYKDLVAHHQLPPRPNPLMQYIAVNQNGAQWASSLDEALEAGGSGSYCSLVGLNGEIIPGYML